MKKIIKSGTKLFIVSIFLIGCGSTSDTTSNNTENNHSNDNSSIINQHNEQGNTIAYFGDKENNLLVIVDVDNMKVIDSIATGHEKTYAAEEIKTLQNKHNNYKKMYIDNRGSDAIDVFDPASNRIIKTIKLDFHPRSIDVEKETGLVAVSGSDKAMTAIIDSSTDEVIATVGENIVTYPTTSGHSYVSSGTLASGHPHWLNANHFVLIDRQNKKIITYKIVKNSDQSWSTTKVNELTTPSPLHNLVPPEIHGQHGQRGHDKDIYLSTIFYATAEGATDIYPSVLKLEFKEGTGLSLVEELKIQKEGLNINEMGVHHLNFLKNQKTIYVGSDEGTLFIVDYSVSPMKITKTIQAGKGAGHTDEIEHNGGIAIVINHKDNFITVMNTSTDEKIADIKVSNIVNEVGTVQTQSHPQYHFSKDGRYFYLFLTEEGELVKIDLINKKVVQRLEIGGKLAMGTFTH